MPMLARGCGRFHDQGSRGSLLNRQDRWGLQLRLWSSEILHALPAADGINRTTWEYQSDARSPVAATRAGLWQPLRTHEIVVAAQKLPLQDPDPADRFFGRYSRSSWPDACDGRSSTV